MPLLARKRYSRQIYIRWQTPLYRSLGK